MSSWLTLLEPILEIVRYPPQVDAIEAAARAVSVRVSDQVRAQVARRLNAGGGAQLSCVDADTTSPAVAISSDATAPVTGPFSIAIAFSEPVTGFELSLGEMVWTTPTLAGGPR